tara:strand:+ start:5256 stop:6134 length:879 start_codon:yes stop_codon:yes gene_type:complete
VSQSHNARLLIIDGHHLAYRSFYAIRSMHAPDGFPTNAIYGFIRAFEKMRNCLSPSHIAVIWDGGLDEDRTEVLDEYKADRDPMPDEMDLQLDCISEWLEASGIYSYCGDGLEADDLIGTLAKRSEAKGFETIIASADKDFFQLINSKISLLNSNDKTGKLWGSAEVEAKTGVKPHQIVDWLSLVGDSVDGIPGVPGVGPKTAAKLLINHGDIKNIYERISDISREKLRESLVAAKDDVIRNQKLVTLKDIKDWKVNWEDFQPHQRDLPLLREQYRNWNFRTMLKDVEEDLF